MNSRQKKTLALILKDPVSGAIEWSKVESLLIDLGVRAIEGDGSRVKFEKDGLVASFHRPHPDKYAKRYQICDMREFLVRIGVKP